MRKIGWVLYGIIIALLHIGGIAISVSTGQPVALPALGTLMMIIYLTGLYGYVFSIRISNRQIWQFIPWIMVFGLIVDTLRHIPTEGLLIALAPVLLTVPLIYALFCYGYWSTRIWGSDEQESISLN